MPAYYAAPRETTAHTPALVLAMHRNAAEDSWQRTIAFLGPRLRA